MTRIIVLFTMLLTPFTLAAALGPVMGAFGLKFGQEMDVQSLEQLATEKGGGVEYVYMPDNPYGPLTEYSVFVTPESKRVYKIKAVGYFGTMKLCRSELLRLERTLEGKYIKTSSKVTERFGDIPRISFGRAAGKVRATCEGIFNQRQLILFYEDEDLAAEAGREYRSSSGPAQAVGVDADTSGL